MNVILLSGGSGKRLWPLSNEVRSKQFLKIFSREDGTKESMAQRMFRTIKNYDPEAKITIATSENQVPQIQSQLGDDVEISVEPTRRDTFPAIALAAAFLKKQGVGDNESVVVCPVDSYVEEDYIKCLMEVSENTDKANLTLVGIEPTYPSEKYGYIIPENSNHFSPVVEFKEKPDREKAQMLLSKGALWNGGVFAFKLSYLLSVALKVLGTNSYEEIYDKYSSFDKISFDYAVVEKEKKINVIRYKGEWRDLGTWNTLCEAMVDKVSGSAMINECEDTYVVNELGIPLIALGVDNAIIAATPDGILVSDKNASDRLKDYVEDKRPMYERRGWGEYKVLDYKIHDDGQNSLTKELIIEPGKHISYQIHKHRTEIWTFTEGVGELILDDEIKRVSRGDVAIIKAGTKHAIKGISKLHIIEVQIGDKLIEEDIERLDWNWDE